MVEYTKPISATVKFFLPVFLMTFLFACKKTITTTDTTTKAQGEEATSYAPSGGNTNCYDIELLLPHSDGTLTGYVENEPIQISNVITQAYDNNGNPIVYVEGDPFWGQISLTSNTAEVLYNASSPQDDQFGIRIWQMGASIVNVSAYQSALSTYLNGQSSTPGNVANYLFTTGVPKISDYTTTAGSLGYHDVVGRLIRINPTQVQSGTDAYGNPVFVTTTFALAPPCYPRPGIRPGTTAAPVSPRNGDGCTSPSSVDFIKDGMVVRTIDFPTTQMTTGPTVSVPSGTYYLRFTMPTGYPELSFRIWGGGTSGYWETGNISGSIQTFTTPNTYTLSAGTSYTLNESGQYQ